MLAFHSPTTPLHGEAIGVCLTRESRKTYMVRKHHVAVLPVNHVGAFYIGLCVSGGSYVKCSYMIGREYSHVVLPDHASISPSESPKK